MAITTGMAEVVLTYSATTYGSLMKVIEKMIAGQPVEEKSVIMPQMGLKGSFEMPYGSNMPGIFFAQMANRYTSEYGITREQLNRYLGAIAISLRHNAILNGKRVMKKLYL
jgi:acetyl-CoA acetyltransferase